MKKILIYYNFIIVSLIVVVGFLFATNYIELLVAALFYPLFIYFAIRVIPRKSHAARIAKEQQVVIQPAVNEDGKKLTQKEAKLQKEGVDIDRRAFLKLIGTAGLSLFLFSIFTKRAEAAFFGSVPGPGTVSLKDSSGNKIDPAEKQPTDGYKITDIDDSSPSYYGFVNKDGGWFIQKEDDTTGAYRYTKGSSGYSANWSNRSSLTYDYFSNVF